MTGVDENNHHFLPDHHNLSGTGVRLNTLPFLRRENVHKLEQV